MLFLPAGAIDHRARREPVASGGGTPVVWHAASKHADITLTNGGLTAELTGAGGSNRALRTDKAISVKCYFEMLVHTITGDNPTVGLGPDTFTNTGAPGGAYGNGWRANGSMAGSGGVSFTEGPWSGTPGVVLGFAVDPIAKLIWYTKDGSTWYGTSGTDNPATPTGGYSFTSATTPRFAIAAMWTTGDKITFNGGASAFAFTPPTGFPSYNSI